MTDLASDIGSEAAPSPSSIISFALKNGAGEVSVDTANLPDDVYREALMQGLKSIAERAMSKITKANIPNEDERRAEIKAKALANIEDMYAGKTKITGQATVKKASGAVMTEAMRLARNLVRDWLKSQKIKISTVKASEITKTAKGMIADNPSLIVTAAENIKAREAIPITTNLAALIQADPELVAKAAAKAAKDKANKPLSKMQAGMVAPKAKGAKPGTQAHA